MDQKNQNRSLAVACAVFLIIAGWYISGIIGDMSSFMDWDKPAEVSKMIKAGIFGLIGALLALGVDVKSMLGPLGAFIPGTTTTQVESTVKTTATTVVPAPPVPDPVVPPVVPPSGDH